METSHKARVPYVEMAPVLRGTALAKLVSFAGTTPREYATDGVGARGLITEANSAALLDRLAAGTQHLANQTEGVTTVLSTDGSGVPYHRRAVYFRCGRYLVDARSGFRSGSGQPLSAFQEQPREQNRRARVGHLHGGQMCMGFRCDCCCCLPGPCPGGTIAIDLNDCDDFSRCVRE